MMKYSCYNTGSPSKGLFFVLTNNLIKRRKKSEAATGGVL